VCEREMNGKEKLKGFWNLIGSQSARGRIRHGKANSGWVPGQVSRGETWEGPPRLPRARLFLCGPMRRRFPRWGERPWNYTSESGGQTAGSRVRPRGYCAGVERAVESGGAGTRAARDAPGRRRKLDRAPTRTSSANLAERGAVFVASGGRRAPRQPSSSFLGPRRLAGVAEQPRRPAACARDRRRPCHVVSRSRFIAEGQALRVPRLSACFLIGPCRPRRGSRETTGEAPEAVDPRPLGGRAESIPAPTGGASRLP
jgi:hypothetical protein